MNESHNSLDLPPEKGIPTMITWNYGGKDVAVEGSWDNWKSRYINVSLTKYIYIFLFIYFSSLEIKMWGVSE